MLGLKSLSGSRIFWAVLVLKLLLGLTAGSWFLRDLFIPFINRFAEAPLESPWEYFFALGRLDSFPYPTVMLLILGLPRLLLSPFLEGGVDVVTNGHLLVMRLPLLVGDLVVAAVLLHWFPHRARRVLLYYWCSPVVIYVCYWHGQLDIIPTAIFMLSLAFLRENRNVTGMILLGLATCAKTHLLAAWPFVLVYLVHRIGLLRSVQLLLVSVLSYLLPMVPYLGSHAFRIMVFGTAEQSRLFTFFIPVGPQELSLLLAPSAVVALWFRFTAYARKNWDLFVLYVGVLFSVFVLLIPPRPGYFLWSLPFVVFFICRSTKTYQLPYQAYSISYLLFFWLSRGSDLFDAWSVTFPALSSITQPLLLLEQSLGPLKAGTVVNLVYTMMEVSLAGIVLNMYLFGVRSNAVYRMRTTPFMIGVAGDSASGKDSFVELLSQVLGRERVTSVAGDDYHRWPRGHEMWQVFTHLDVQANELHLQQEHAIAVRDGRTIIKGSYDHSTGQFTEAWPLDPDQYVVYQGLHSLSMETMRNLYDLKVFLDPNEELRRRWKIQRDTRERGHNAEDVLKALEEREPDRAKFIIPQRAYADILVHWMPREEIGELSLDAHVDVDLHVMLQNSFGLARALQELSRYGSVRFEHEPYIDAKWQALVISGTITRGSLSSVARSVIPNLEEIAPMFEFTDGLPGCLQLIFLICISDKMSWSS
jgi:uridine kinase